MIGPVDLNFGSPCFLKMAMNFAEQEQYRSECRIEVPQRRSVDQRNKKNAQPNKKSGCALKFLLAKTAKRISIYNQANTAPEIASRMSPSILSASSGLSVSIVFTASRP